MAKLVDAGDSKSPAARCVGSSPTLGTMENKPRFAVIFLPVVWAHLIASLRITTHFLGCKLRKLGFYHSFSPSTQTHSQSVFHDTHAITHAINRFNQPSITSYCKFYFWLHLKHPVPLLHPLSSLRLSHCFYSTHSTTSPIFFNIFAKIRWH